jgi:hypothetical protein
MKKLLLLLLFIFSTTALAASNSNPGLYYGQVPTPTQWNSYFSAKLDYSAGSINTIPYWDGSGNLLNAAISGDCTSVANVFTCSSFGHNVTVTGSFGATTINNASSHLMVSTTAPIIASGFGTSPSIVASNGTAAFTVNVGTGGTATSGVITMPAATTGWSCNVTPNAAPQAAAIMYSAPTSNTSITITNYTLTTGAALAWTASTVIAVRCTGY